MTPIQVAESVIDTSRRALRASAGAVHILVRDDSALELVHAAGYDGAHIDPQRRLPLTLHAPAVEVAQTGEAVWISSQPAWLRVYPDLLDEPPPAAFAAIPLIVGQGVIGAISLSFAEPREFSPEDREFLLTLARVGAQALDRARLYAEEQRARADAEAAVRLRDHFISVAAHELRTPLAVLYGQAQLLQRRLQGDVSAQADRNRRSVDVIVTQAERLNRMINALLDIGRIDQGRLSLDRIPTDRGALAQPVVADVRPTLARHTLVIEEPDAPLIVNADPARLEQVLHNLVSNAVKFSPSGGTVRIVLAREDQQARLSVIDEGIGIPAVAQPHIFDRFYRAPNAERLSMSGTGLGLFMVKQIVTLHGGMVAVDSHEGAGSAFTIWLPLRKSNTQLEP